MAYFGRRIDRNYMHSRKRAERLKAARRIATHTKAEWEAVRDIIGVCVHCGGREYPLGKDHIIPLYQGGSDGIDNLQPSCARCNAGKGADNEDKRRRYCPNWEESYEARMERRVIASCPLSGDILHHFAALLTKDAVRIASIEADAGGAAP